MRQYVTQRYNRVINRAVIDEMSKQFLISGKKEPRELGLKELERSRSAPETWVKCCEPSPESIQYDASVRLNKEMAPSSEKLPTVGNDGLAKQC